MNPCQFPQANARLGPPEGFAESQVMTIPAFIGQVASGSVDGATLVVVAWKPTSEELEQLNAGGAIYLSCIGGLPPHFLTTDFEQATRPA